MVERIRALLEARQLTPTQFADAIGIARPIVSHILSGRNKPSLEVVQRILAAMPDLSMPWLLNGTGPMLAGAVVGMPPAAAPAPATAPVEKAAPAAKHVTDAPADSPTVVEAPVAAPAVVPAPAAAPTAAPAAVDAPTIIVAPSQPRRQPAPVAVAVPAKAHAAIARPALKRFAPGKPKPADAQAPTPAPVPAEPTAEPVLQPAAPPPVAAPEPPAQAVAPPTEPAPAALPPAAPTTTDGSATAASLFAHAEKPIRRIVIFYRDGSFADYQPE